MELGSRHCFVAASCTQQALEWYSGTVAGAAVRARTLRLVVRYRTLPESPGPFFITGSYCLKKRESCNDAILTIPRRRSFLRASDSQR